MKRNEKVLKLVYIALFAALTAALSQVAIPTPWVPLTLQTFAAALCGYMLGWKGGLAALAVYLLLGAAGVPVFANFKAGAQALVGPTGGFLFGFLPMAALCGLQIGRKRAVTGILLGLLGLLLCHAAGYAAVCVGQSYRRRQGVFAGFAPVFAEGCAVRSGRIFSCPCAQKKDSAFKRLNMMLHK